MRRIFVGDGKWFDATQAESYPGRLPHTIGMTLFRTRKGQYLTEDRDPAEEEPRYVAMHEKNAWAWLVDNGYDNHVPDEFLADREV